MGKAAKFLVSKRRAIIPKLVAQNPMTVFVPLCGFTQGPYVDFYPGWKGSFEYKTGNEKRGRKKIKQLIKVLNSEDEKESQVSPLASSKTRLPHPLKEKGDNIEAAIGELIDLDSFYTFWAVEGLLGFWDGYSGNHNNFFIYLNPETDKFHFIPWGADSVFTKSGEFNYHPHAPISVKTQGLIAYKLYQLKSGRERYAKTIMDVMEKHWNEEELLAEIDRIEAMVKPHLVRAQIFINEKKQQAEYTFANSLAETRQFIRQRRADITQETINGMPEWMEPPGKPLTIPTDEIKAFSCGCATGGYVGSVITILVGWIIKRL